jgi:prepilin peptidase CpaA
VILHYASWVILAGVLIVAAVCDIRRGKAYNWLTYPAIVVGLAMGAAEGAATGSAWDGLTNHIMGFGIGFGVLFAAYVLGGMGGGDVKLMAAVGAFVGSPAALHAVMYSFLVGAALGLVLVVWRGQARESLRRLGRAIRILPLPTVTMDEAVPTSTLQVPFAFAVCVGTLWYLAEQIAGGSLWDAVSRLWAA